MLFVWRIEMPVVEVWPVLCYIYDIWELFSFTYFPDPSVNKTCWFHFEIFFQIHTLSSPIPIALATFHLGPWHCHNLSLWSTRLCSGDLGTTGFCDPQIYQGDALFRAFALHISAWNASFSKWPFPHFIWTFHSGHFLVTQLLA